MGHLAGRGEVGRARSTIEGRADMASSIFSTYSTGENRVTSSIMAVLQSLALPRIERLLGSLLEQSEFQLVRFDNQVSSAGPGIPDAEIAASCRILVETKIRRDAIKVDQLKRHLKKISDAKESTKLVLVLTPDEPQPKELEEFQNEPITWASFSMLDQAIDDLLDDKLEVVSEREAFLLRQLQAMLATEGLLGLINNVLVVPARNAWPRYQLLSAYVCQPNRAFQRVERMAFYCEGRIQVLVPKVLEVHDEVTLLPGSQKNWLNDLIEQVIKLEPSKKGATQKVIRLTPPDDKDTIRLSAPIPNDLKSKAGRPTAFTQSQRYVSLAKLKEAKTTSDLKEQ
jgi:hypothetical protein